MQPQPEPTEIELTLRLRPDDVPKLLEAPALAALRAGKARARSLHSTYFDTPDLALKRARAVIRVRRVGRRFVQTVKAAPPPDGASIVRREWERDLSRPVPDLSGLAAIKELGDVLGDAAVLQALRPIFTTDFKRITIPLRIGRSDIELAIDRGEIRVDGARAPICEIELELVSGEIGDVYAAAARLMEAVPMALQPFAKSARAHALLSGEGVRPVRATRVRLHRRDSVGVAFRAIARTCLRQLMANAVAILAGDEPLAMHQFRVSLRRLRSAFSAFGSTMPAAERRRFATGLRRVAQRTDAARELDVFVGETLPAVRGGIGPDEGLVAVEAAAKRARLAAWKRVRDLLDGPAFAAIVLDLEAWLEGGGWRAAAGARFDAPVRDFARAALKRLHRKLVRQGKGIASLSENELHEVRLRGKKQRYAAEFFRDVFASRAAKPYLSALAAVQDHLGTLNDVATVRLLLARLRPRGARGAAEFDRGGALVLGWCVARTARQIEELPATWESFTAQRPFWK
jgi:triphosphatase